MHSRPMGGHRNVTMVNSSAHQKIIWSDWSWYTVFFHDFFKFYKYMSKATACWSNIIFQSGIAFSIDTFLTLLSKVFMQKSFLKNMMLPMRQDFSSWYIYVLHRGLHTLLLQPWATIYPCCDFWDIVPWIFKHPQIEVKVTRCPNIWYTHCH